MRMTSKNETASELGPKLKIAGIISGTALVGSGIFTDRYYTS